MKLLLKVCLGVVLVLAGVPVVSADPVGLTDWAFNVNGTVYANPAFSSYQPPTAGFLPGSFDVSAFDWATGLGTIVITYNPGAVGTYFFTAFFDFELSNSVNGPNNEYGDYPLPPSPQNPSGITPAAGQTWQIGDPLFGDIWYNATDATNALNNTNTRTLNNAGDTALALGWSFDIVDPSVAAQITLVLSPNGPPSSGFYLAQFDNPNAVTGAPGTDAKVYFSGTIEGVQAPQTEIPEPGSLALLVTVLLGAGLAARRGTARP